MSNLIDDNKALLEKQIKQISTKDEKKVLKNISKELEKLNELADKNQSHKIKNLITNAELLHAILVDKDFPLSESSRKWIVFGLGYLISDLDLIPDAIPVIGYNDDALILQWVIHMIDADISRFNIYTKAKQLAIKGGIIQEVIPGNADEILIIIPGFLDELQVSSESSWTNLYPQVSKTFNQATVYMPKWELNHLSDLLNVLRIVDHQLTLKTNFDNDEFDVQWKQVKLEFSFIGQALAMDIRELKNRNSKLNISIAAIGPGCFAAEQCISNLNKNIIKNYYALGSTISNIELPNIIFSKVSQYFNYFNPDDYLLKFIFENFENNTIPIGIKPLISKSNTYAINRNMNHLISRHSDYKTKFASIF
jgi:uncharacterized membrane protein YkvA (DUF1232 family)